MPTQCATDPRGPSPADQPSAPSGHDSGSQRVMSATATSPVARLDLSSQTQLSARRITACASTARASVLPSTLGSTSAPTPMAVSSSPSGVVSASRPSAYPMSTRASGPVSIGWPS